MFLRVLFQELSELDQHEFSEFMLTNVVKSTYLVYTGFLGELEHLKIETRLIDETCDEKFVSVMGECVI